MNHAPLVLATSTPLRRRTLSAAMLLLFLLPGRPAPALAQRFETKTEKGERIQEWFFRIGGGKVEAYAIWPAGKGPHPALLLIHGGRGRAQRFRRAMFLLAGKNRLATMAISLPGFGASTGPDDYAGPRSVAAAVHAIKYLAAHGDVRPGGVAVYGIGPGATTALLAAERTPHVRLVAVHGGVYDLERAYGKLPPRERERIRQLLGGGPKEVPQAYRARSPIRGLGRIVQPVLILHSPRARRVPISEAEALAAALRARGKPFRFLLTRDRDEFQDPRFVALKKAVVPFVRQYLGF